MNRSGENWPETLQFPKLSISIGTMTESNFSKSIQTKLVELLSTEIFLTPDPSSNRNGIDRDRQPILEGFESPLDYPPLTQTVFAGDQVAIALQTGLPQPASVLTAILRQLEQSQVAAADIIVVVSPATAVVLGMPPAEIEAAAVSASNEVPSPWKFELEGFHVNLLVHHLSSPAAVAYLAANEGGDPIYLNRCLVDADVVLPVGFSQAGRDRTPDSLYPEFSNSETQRRFASEAQDRLRQDKEIQLANDTLGSFFSIRVVAGPGGLIDAVFTGARAAVVEEADRHARRVWTYQGPVDCDIVVVTIESATGACSWDDFVPALIAANRISTASSPIVVWSELSGRPGKLLRQAMLAQFDEVSRKKFPPDLLQLIEIMKEHPIFLYSQLSRDEVESLGIGFVDSAAQINRIGEGRERGTVLRDAHKWAFEKSGSSKARVFGKH